MSLKAVFSVIVLIWSWMRTFHRSTPSDRAGDGSKRAPSVHCCERSGFRPPAPVDALPPDCSLYSNGPLWQYCASSAGTLAEHVSLPVTPKNSSGLLTSPMVGILKPVPNEPRISHWLVGRK